jgi:hypothetical protein
VNLGRKTATALIEPGTDDAESPTGSFHVILSTPELDRDGETLPTDEWEQPLPARIPFDIDHGMTVETTIGSGVPSIEDGVMHVRGTYSGLKRAQDVRQLVNEGHISTTSVTYLTKRVDGKTTRELLNGTFTPIPSNRGSVVLASKGAKAVGDARRVQAIHDHAVNMGATCTPGNMGKSVRALKASTPVSDKPWSDFTAADYTPAQWHRACVIHDHPAGQVPDDKEHCKLPIREPDGTLNRNGVHAAASVLAGGRGGVQASPEDKAKAARAVLAAYRAIGDDPPDSLTALAGKSLRAKAAGANDYDGLSVGDLAQATDSALDHATELLADVDLTDLPPVVQEAIALVQAAGASVDELLDAMGLPDPDDLDDESAAADTDAPAEQAGASKSAAADEELNQRRQSLLKLARGALRETYESQGKDGLNADSH